MHYDFAAAIRSRRDQMRARGRPDRRIGRLPRQLQPDRQREVYFRDLRQLTTRLAELIEAELVPALPSLVAEAGIVQDAATVRSGNWVDTLRGLLHRVRTRLAAEWRSQRMAEVAEKIGRATSDFQRQQIVRQFRSALGVEPLLREPGTEQRVADFTARNVALIKSIPAQAQEELRDGLIERIRAGERTEQIRKWIVGRNEITERRAKVIARDQVGKFYGDLNRLRQQELGVEAFIWRTMDDDSVCRICAQRDGQRFAWAALPAAGYPGTCHVDDRCVAEPDVSGLFERL